MIKRKVITSILIILMVSLLTGCTPKAEFQADITSGQAPLMVTFTNMTSSFPLMNADEFQWDFGDGTTTTSGTKEELVTHEYTKAGSHTVTLTAVKEGDPPKTTTMTLTVTVKPGPLHAVKLTPKMTEMDIGQSQEFSAEALDAYDNPFPGAQLSWNIAEGVGTLADGGIITVGTKAGTFNEGIVVTTKQGTYSAKGSASITVKPASLNAVTITPVEVAVEETQLLEAVATDQYGNRVSEVEDTWTLTDGNAGSITQAGLLTANEVAGTFREAVEVYVTQGELVRTAVGSVTIKPGPLEQVIIGPDTAEIGIEMTQQFVAIGADRYGNRISGLDFIWSVESGAGTIDAVGLFTAGSTPDTFSDAITAEVTQGDVTRSSTVSVTVEPDRIIFLSDRNDDQWDIYLMEVDGSNQERLTTGNVKPGNISYSPDGRRIVYNAGDDIFTINDDGTWNISILSGRKAYEPAWSPDGTKIAFQSWEHDPSEIYVMDVDGGNLVRLTDNSAYDDYPAWSPDGTEIAFISDRDGNEEIYVMNADGSNQRRLTNHPALDVYPIWSPDGTEILFQSDRSGRCIHVMDADGSNVRRLTPTSYTSNAPSWSPGGTKILFHSFRDSDKAEIYIMDRDGSDMTRLTNNSAKDYTPQWFPRKRGIEVTEVSVIIPEASTLEDMTAQEVTSQARQAVVRIETDLGSGSGFIIEPGGLVLTNNHVVSDAKEVTVYLFDDTSYQGIIKSRDQMHDLAIIEIEATGLPCLELGDLSQVGLGQPVVVLGYPLKAEDVSVTSGLVSTINYDSGRNITWVQTDSAINPGNSGGPMLNLQGQVIGIVSVKMVGLSVEGVGFAISANTVNTYLPQMK